MLFLRFKYSDGEIGLGEHLIPHAQMHYPCIVEEGKLSLWEVVKAHHEVACELEYRDVGQPPTVYRYRFLLRTETRHPDRIRVVPKDLVSDPPKFS
jgi:hypothetical protein